MKHMKPMKPILTPFWFSYPSILVDQRAITEIFPSKRFDIVRKLNAIVRLSIVYSAIMYAHKREKNYLMIPVVALGVTWFIWSKQGDIVKDEVMKRSMSDQLSDLVKLNDLETECRIPKKDNPFMNPTFADYGNNKPPAPKSCPSYNNVGVQRRVEDLFNEDLYREVQDVFGKNNSQRQFFTVPGNQVPNDQGAFAQWLYGTPPTCKEGNKTACLSANGHGGGGPGGPP
jgi:hypothetical protein